LIAQKHTCGKSLGRFDRQGGGLDQTLEPGEIRGDVPAARTSSNVARYARLVAAGRHREQVSLEFMAFHASRLWTARAGKTLQSAPGARNARQNSARRL
jgi:hypothetical protein